MTSFHDFALPQPLLRAIDAMGFETPTDIQRSAIPALLAGRDVVGIAQTGTGKTAAFGLPLLSHVDGNVRGVQALVLTPTRELAIQVADAITGFAEHTKVQVIAIYGGSSYVPQLRALKQGAQVVVGTPGRVMDMIERGALDLSNLRVFVLDEADEMLSMGFAEDIEVIATTVPKDRLTALFSATMPTAIARVAATHLRDPLRIEVTSAASTVSTIEQTYAVVPFRFKTDALARVLAVWRKEGAIVFVRTRAAAEEVATELMRRGVSAAPISGDVAQNEREKLIGRLRSGALDVLIATDVAARGLDVERIGLVVNFDVPREPDAYVHRIGRTGRAGREGQALTFFTPKEFPLLRHIEKHTGTELKEVTVPSPEDVLNHEIEQSLGRLPVGDLSLFREAVAAMEAEPIDVAAALLAASVNVAPVEARSTGRARREERFDSTGRFLAAEFEPHGGGTGSAARAQRTGGPKTPRRGPKGNARRYRVEVGHKDRVQPGAIVGALTGDGKIAGGDIGKIDIYPSFALVELYTEPSSDQVRRLQKSRVSGRALRMAPDPGAPGKRRR